MKKVMVLAVIALFSSGAFASNVNLSSPQWLGNYQLDGDQLKSIRDAVKKAFSSPIDAEHQCGEVRLDCVVRAAREWDVDGQKHREIVIHIHTLGHTSQAVGQENGKWPEVVMK